jgi:4-hydroxyphenylpyruvate dioxygenase
MSKPEPLGILRLEALHYYVRDLERSRAFYTQKLDFAEVATSSPEMEQQGKQRLVVFDAGDCRVGVSAPLGEGGRAWRFLRKRAEGVGSIVFEVEDVQRTFRLLEGRGGTPIQDIQWHSDDHGTIGFFSITTPFGDTTFRFVERKNFGARPGWFPGWQRTTGARPTTECNRFGIEHFDHVTSNFQTMAPAVLWMEHVLGFERFWDIEFHTEDVQHGEGGSGLRSIVMWDPHSHVKFANNEPYRPFFKNSQINIFNEEHRGDGVQHVALHVRDLIEALRGLRARGVHFMPTPSSYYDALPARLQRLGIESIDEDIATLQQNEILVDGHGKGSYLLQIFLKESASMHGDPTAGPFFFELIHRKGDKGFGEGNFRALFESIERTQQS